MSLVGYERPFGRPPLPDPAEPPPRVELGSPAYETGASPTYASGAKWSTVHDLNMRKTAWKAAASPLGQRCRLLGF